MKDVKSWHENDAFWKTLAPMVFREQMWANVPLELDGVISLLKISPGARVLDLCCGPGRHSLELARRGFKVTGVDRTKLYLDEAQRRAEAEGLKIEFVQDDMRAFCRPSTFDAAINLYTSFGYFKDPEEDRQVVINIYRSLKSDGALIIDIMGKEILARVFKERDWLEEKGTFVLQERKLSQNWSWMEGRWIVFKDNKRDEFTISHRLYSGTELSSLLVSCGFKHIDIFGGYDGSPYDQNARRMVVVARN